MTSANRRGSVHSHCTEESLGQIEAVQARLAQDEIELRREIEALRAELKRDQDPNRMQLIQETISVCVLLLYE